MLPVVFNPAFPYGQAGAGAFAQLIVQQNLALKMRRA
jgi:hypothetical protein